MDIFLLQDAIAQIYGCKAGDIYGKIAGQRQDSF